MREVFPIYHCSVKVDDSVSIRSAWKQVFRDSIRAVRFPDSRLSDISYVKHRDYPPLLAIWPTSPFLALTDDQMVLVLRVILELLVPTDRRCTKDASIHFAALSPKDFTDHIFGCTTCAAKHTFVRHERVVHAIHSTLKFYQFSCRIPKGGELPKPSRRRGGSDLIITRHSKAYHIDVKTLRPYQNEVKKAAAAKFLQTLKDYSEYQSQFGLHTIPFVIDICGPIFPKTVNLIKEMILDGPYVTNQKAVLNAVCSAAQIALVRGFQFGFQFVGIDTASQKADHDQSTDIATNSGESEGLLSDDEGGGSS